MNINTRNLSFVKFNNEEMQFVKFNGVTVYEAWKKLIASGVPPLTLLNCKGVDLVDYKIYGNSVQDGIPTPETPIEMQSVGDKTKNLFNLNKITTNGRGIEEFENKLCFHYKDGYSNFELPTNCKENTQYTLTFKIYRKEEDKNKITNIKLYYSDGTFMNKIVSSNQTNNIVSLQGKTLIKISGSESYNLDTWIDLSVTQLEEGTTATDYEPYGYKIPVKVSGKNLFDGQTDYSWSGGGTPSIQNIPQTSPATYNKYQGCAFTFPVTGGKTYTISGDFNASGAGQLVSSYRNQRYGTGAVTNWGVKLPITVTVPADTTWLIIAYWSNSDNNAVSWSNIQCEEGNEATEYTEPINPIITNIYLDEPLTINDYIHYKKQELSKNGVPTTIELPNIPTFKGTTILSVDTTIQPSNLEAVYKGKEVK